MSSAAYDSIVYDASAHTHTHPTRLATMAHLMGLSPPDVRTSRILELGCATGTNLFAIAEGYPEASFLGIDYSAKQIEAGNARIAASGIGNLRLEHRSIADISEADGTFDYIIAHGVYSWIPKQMQEKLLQICSRNLSKNGVAYVSYNTLPGWSLNGLVRDIMMFHTRHFKEQEQVPHAKAILQFLSQNSPADTPYGQLLRETSARLAKQQDYYLAHEYLEVENEAIHFHEFVSRVRTHELEYLAEVELGSMLPNFLPADVLNIITQFSKDFIDYEQYLDFLRARSFRQSLLVHTDAPLVRQITPARIASLSAFPTFAAHVALAEINRDEKSVRFNNALGHTVDSADPLFKAILRTLADAAPMTLSVDEIVAAIPPTDDKMTAATWREIVCMRLLEAFGTGLVRLVKDPPQTDYAVIDERPKVSAVARVEAGFGKTVTIKGHQGQQWDFVHLKIVGLLDGTRTRGELGQLLAESHRKGEFKFADGTDNMPATIVTAKLAALLDHILQNVRNAGLLRF